MACSYKDHKILFILTNISLTLCVGIIFFLTEYDIIPQNQPKFYCNDSTIAYTYTGDTVSTVAVSLMAVFIPLCLVVLVELANYYFDKSQKEFTKSMLIAATWFKEYAIVMVLNLLIVHIFKYTFGEPRPDFLDSCQPDVCSQNSYITGLITEYKCQQTIYGESVARNSKKSFLSGHAASSVYAGVFMFWYIQKRVCEYAPRFVGHTLQIGAIALSIICSITRITDHRHHWWDVLCGAILGAFLAVYVIEVYCNNFSIDAFKSSKISAEKSNVTNDHRLVQMNE